MPAKSSSNIYVQVVTITRVYLGPAADRFIDRQIESHLGRSAGNLSKTELRELIDWVRLSMSLLTEDKDLVEEYVSQLYKLTDQSG